jgi:CheY-like chemotaxis protein
MGVQGYDSLDRFARAFEPAPTSVSATSPNSPGIVLVVDDDSDLRETIQVLLESHGHQVAMASDGAEALAWLGGQGAPPCVVLLDLMMPGMSGFDLRSHMRANPALARVPVVVITGAGVLAEQRADELQAEILRKPIDLHTLLGTVRRFCQPEARSAPKG